MVATRIDHTPLRIDGVFVCKECRAPLCNTRSDGSRQRPPEWCLRCLCARNGKARVQSGQQQAHSAISSAIARGAIPRASELTCVDCRKRAQQYDHRDYGRPLDVVPVCRSCNQLRGPALWRTANQSSSVKA